MFCRAALTMRAAVVCAGCIRARWLPWDRERWDDPPPARPDD